MVVGKKKREIPLQFHDSTTSWTLALGMIFHVTAVRPVATRSRACFILAFVNLWRMVALDNQIKAASTCHCIGTQNILYLSIGVSQLDSNVTFQFVLESDGLYEPKVSR